MADPELAKDLTAEQEEFAAKYEFLSHRFFKFNNSALPSSARNIHFICLLCPRKTLIACSKKNTANLRMHIERQHPTYLEVRARKIIRYNRRTINLKNTSKSAFDLIRIILFM